MLRLASAAIVFAGIAWPLQAATYLYEYTSAALTADPAELAALKRGFPEASATLPGFTLRMGIDEALVPGGSLANADLAVFDVAAGILQPYVTRFDGPWNYSVPGQAFVWGEGIVTDAGRNIVSWSIGSADDPEDFDIFGVAGQGMDAIQLSGFGADSLSYFSDSAGSWRIAAVFDAPGPQPGIPGPDPIAPVPLPASAWMLLAALAGFGAFSVARGRAEPAMVRA